MSALLLGGSCAWAADLSSLELAVAVPRVERAPVLEDFLEMTPNNELAVKLAKVEGFIQREPSDGQPATQRTEVYLGYDAEKLYVIFVCFDSEPDKVRARMIPRENIRGDDLVEVMFDTFNDQRRAYGFLANPFGIQLDGLFAEGGGGGFRGFDSSFDTLWYSAGRLTDQGYVVWMAIPFKSLRFPSNRRQTWGVTFHRTIPRVNEDAFWPHISSRIDGRLNQAATLNGLENISPGRNMQLIPFVTARSFRGLDTRDDDRPAFVRDRADPDVGLDAKFVLKDSLALDVALNPDFSQVESDEPQSTVNQRFEVRFPEKRPFFLENAGFFDTPINLVFTRRIADPRFGARLTGKLGPYALGAFVIDDESPGKSVPEGDPEEGKRALFGIVRVSRDIFEESSVGLLYTQREYQGSYNRVGGLDGRIKLGPNWALEFQGVASASQSVNDDDELERSAGPAYSLELTRRGRQLFYGIEYNDFSPGFDTDVGFVRRVDIRRVGQRVRYRFRPEGKYLISWGPFINTEAVFDHSGTRLDLTQDSQISWEFVGQTNLSFSYDWERERLRPADFDELPENRDFSHGRKGFSVRSSYWDFLSVNARYNWGTRINYRPPEDEEPVLADFSTADVTLTLRPFTPLRIDNTYLLNRLLDRGSDASIFNNHIIRSKWNWQFNRELSLRVILQYEATLANPELTRVETRKNINADVLFTYLVNPGTVLYIGYNGNARNLDPALRLEGPADDLSLVRPRRQFINDAKQFFIKFSYLIRF